MSRKGWWPLPSWAINLAGFGVLILLVLAVFFLQMREIRHDLEENTLSRSQMMATIIEEHLANAHLAAKTIDVIISSFLRDKARFIEYLEGIDPLQSEELAALASETGLLGIGLIYTTRVTSGNSSLWKPKQQNCSLASDRIHYDQGQQQALYVYPSSQGELRCIQVALDASDIFRLRKRTSLPTLLTNLSQLPGIHAVKLSPTSAEDQEQPVHLITKNNKPIAEARLVTTMGLLSIDLDAGDYFERLEHLRGQFFLFTLVLLLLGIFFSWLLYQHQQKDLQQTRTFERLLAREHEAAALGRATATIAHEVRNPLNALSMGLQRLEMESPSLEPDQQELISAMREAVQRASGIITELQRFTKPLNPRPEPFQPVSVLERLLSLYQAQMQQYRIALQLDDRFASTLLADPELFSELLENLIKNSIEAQTQGGYIHIFMMQANGHFHLSLLSGNCTLEKELQPRLGEPYFTTKTRGTGLGLAECRRIAEAHKGSITFEISPERLRFAVEVSLPMPYKIRPKPSLASGNNEEP